MPTYTRSQLRSDVNANIHGKIGVISDPNTVLNRAARDVRALRLRSLKRKQLLSPNLFNDIYQYNCPTDLDGQNIVGIQPQTGERVRSDEWDKTTEEEFDRYKSTKHNLIAFSSDDLLRKLLISANIDDDSLIIANLDTLTGDGGTWVLFGDGTNLSADDGDFVKGSGAIKWDISAAGGTTAGIQNTGLRTFDLTDYKDDGSIFVWVEITSATNLTNFILRVGSDSSNYYSMTATTTNEGVSFATGWNLLRFDFSGKSTTGTPDDNACDYAALYMTKAAGKVSETGYHFDHIIAKRGQFSYLIYYSKYMWQSSSGTYKENSTDDTDYLNVDTDEYNLVVDKATDYCAGAVKEPEAKKDARERYKENSKEYKRQNPSEVIGSSNTYYNF